MVKKRRFSGTQVAGLMLVAMLVPVILGLVFSLPSLSFDRPGLVEVAGIETDRQDESVL